MTADEAKDPLGHQALDAVPELQIASSRSEDLNFTQKCGYGGYVLVSIVISSCNDRDEGVPSPLAVPRLQSGERHEFWMASL